MHTDADDISRHDALRHNRLQRFIDQDGIARGLRRRRRKNKQPSWRNDGGTKGIVAGVYEMNTHGCRPFPVQARRLRRGTPLLRPAWAIWFLLFRPPTIGTRANDAYSFVRRQSYQPAKKTSEQNCTQRKKAAGPVAYSSTLPQSVNFRIARRLGRSYVRVVLEHQACQFQSKASWRLQEKTREARFRRFDKPGTSA